MGRKVCQTRPLRRDFASKAAFQKALPGRTGSPAGAREGKNGLGMTGETVRRH